MDCGQCGTGNRDGARFCRGCGQALARLCAACGAELIPDSQFCDGCGSAVDGAATAAGPIAPSAVRKTVTVLFADLGGSTGFGERTDAEVSRQVLAQYHARLQAVVDAHAGTVAKFMGDGMMATFGIPEVAEDDARRAVDAGAAMQQGFHEFAAEIDRRYGEMLTLRVGINTGEVVIGAGDADLIGDALNVAARLEKACRPGQVLVGEETWRLTRGEVGYDELGEVTVAGRARPVAIYELALEADAAPEIATPFVGRDAEMQRLVGVFDEARRAAKARLVTVLGSPGVGKTRLSRELCSHLAASADAQRVEIRCDRAGEATFAPVAQLIRDAAGLGEDTDADAARTAIGTLVSESEADHARVVDVLAALVGAGPVRSVEETFWGVRRLIETTAAVRPLVVVIDDIQWAEPLLLDLIEHLAEWVAGAAVLLVGLARPELREVRPSLAEPGRPVAAVVVLDGLDASATEALAAGLLGTDRLPAGLVERLPSSTDGNPLFVRELVRMLVDDRIIRQRADGEWELTIDAEAVDVPPTIQSLLGARVERLPAAERELLEQAAVVGAEFSLGALRELAGAHAAIVPMLEAMRRKELVEPTGTYWGDEPVYRFHHVLIRDAAYRRLLKTTRADLHERVAAWTDRTAADLIGEHETAIAFHYEQAYRYRGEVGALEDQRAELGRRAAELLTTAAQRALGRDDLAAAGASSARALALLPESDAAARADLLMMGCECLLATGDGAAARPLVEELVRTAADDPRLAAWGECYAAQLVGLTDPEGLVTADSQARAAAEALTELGDGSGQAKAHQVRAGLLARLGRVGDAELELDLALAAARTADDRRRVTAVLGAAPDAALFGPSPVARAGGRCLDVVRLLRITTASPSVEAASNRCQAVLEALRGRFDVSRSMLASARASLEELGLRHGLAQTELYAGMVELIAGDSHAAIAPLRAAFAGLGSLGVGADAGQAAALLATALLAEGDVDGAELMAAESEALAGQNLKTAIGWRVARAEVLAARGDLSGAVRLAEEAVGIAAGTDLVIDHADACVALATLRARAGDAAGARASRTDAKRLYEQKGATVPAEQLDEAEVVVAEPAPSPAPSQPASAADASSVENAASRVDVRVAAMLFSGSDRELTDLIAPEFVFEDRRHVVNFGVSDFEASASHLEWGRHEGQVLAPPTPVAVRGERLVLSRRSARKTPTGDDLSSFAVVELDDHGRMLVLIQFDEGDLAAAVEELDARYVAGEGSEHAVMVASNAAWFRAMNEHDFGAMREVSSPDVAIVDHRQLGLPALDLDGFIEWYRTYADFGFSYMTTNLRARGRVILTTVVNDGVDPDGGEVVWAFHSLLVADADSRTERIEIFADDAWDAAVARFDELSGEGAGPAIENHASRAYTRAVVAFRSGADGELADLFAPGYRFDDRSRVVNFGERGLAGAAENAAFMREQGYVSSTPVVIASRGERLALTRGTARTGGGDETGALDLVEVDDEGRLCRQSHFDEDDLAAAIEELDARYVAGEGAEHAMVVTATLRWSAAMNRSDIDELRALAAPGFRMVDRRQLGVGDVDLDGLIEWRRQYADIRATNLITDLRVQGGTMICAGLNRAAGVDGGELAWGYHCVAVVAPDGRSERIELFDEHEHPAALARFEELSRGGAAPPMENAATLAFDEVVTLATGRRFDEFAAVVSADFERVDRRTGVSADPVRGPEAWATAFRSTIESGMDRLGVEHLAIRGERVALDRLMFTSAAGDEIPMLAVIEVDESGRLGFAAWHDEGARAAAVAELDERYVEGEGAEHADVLRAAADLDRCHAERDWDGLRELFHEDTVLVDHRQLGWPAGDRDVVVQMWRELVELVPDHRMVIRTPHVTGRTLLTTVDSLGTTEDGGPVAWVLHSLSTIDASGRITTFEFFDEDDWDAALARFDELTAAPVDSRNPRVENTVIRRRVAWAELIRNGRFDEARARMGEFMSDDGVQRFDRRRTVAAPDTDGPGVADSLQAMYELGLVEVAADPIAVRGERLALYRQVFRSAGGDELVLLTLQESDATDRAAFLANYDETQLTDALAELDARYLAGEGAEHVRLLTSFTDGLRAMQSGDLDTMAALGSPDFEYVDHRPTSFGALDTGAFLEMARSYEDVARTSVVQKVYFADRALIARLWTRGVTADGAEVEWVSHNVWLADGSGRALHGELFAEDDWDAALARFDELSATPAADPRTLEIENTALRVAREGALDVEPVAVRGDRIAAYRSRSTNEAGDKVVLLTAFEVDESDRLIRQVMFDDEDEVAAIDLLDEWYIEGEGASDAAVLTAGREGFREYHARDWSGFRERATPDFVFVDHRPLPWPTSDLDGYLQLMQERVAQVDVRNLVRKLFVQGRVLLSVSDAVGMDEHGGLQHWPLLVLHERGAGAIRRIEYFAPEQFEAALARFDELAAAPEADPRTPEIDTAAARALPRLLRVAQEDFLAAASLFAPDVAHFDHRSLVSLPDGTGLEAVANVYLSMADIYSEFDAPVFAVRGDRLALVLFRATAPEGFETTAWVVVGLDAEGRIDLFWLCDESDLATAVEELDARYVASGEATEAEIDLFGTIAALNRRGWEAFTARLAPDLVTIDHSPLGFPPAGRDEFVRNQMQGLVAMVPDAVVIPVKSIASGDTVLTSFHTIGATAEGSRYEWTPVAVGHRGADGLTDRLEFFPVEDWNAALARFDEVVAESTRGPVSVTSPRLENLATCRAAEFGARTNAGDSEGILALIAPGYEALDRRSVTFGPTTSGEEFLAAAEDLVQVFDEIVTDEVLAIRGERLGVTRARFVSANGFEVAMIGVGEIDDDGRILATVLFDEDDLAGAMQELEDRYVTGEGAADAYTIRRSGDFVRSLAQLDGAATLALLDPAVSLADHRTLGFGTIGLDGIRGILAARTEQIAKDTSYLRTLEVRGDTVIGWWDEREVSPDGTEFDYELFLVVHFVAGRIRHMDWYDFHDHATVYARFEELAAVDARTPTPDNDAVRQMARVLWLGRYDFDRAVELFSPDVEYADRRGVIALPTLTGLEGIGAMFLSVFEVYDDRVIEPIAVRGERLALFRLRMSTAGGAESVSVGLVGLDGEGRIDVMVAFDEDDLAAALEELERRHEELSGDAYPAVERTHTRWNQAFSRGDLDGWRACLSPGARVVDHRPIIGGEVRGETSAHIESWRDLAPDLVSCRTRSHLSGDAMLSALAVRGTTADGSGYEWDVASVGRVDAAGLIAEEHIFPIEQWDDARALFAEWSQPPELEAAGPPVSATALSNRATRAQDVYNAAFAALDWDAMAASYTAEIVNDDRRTGVSSGVTVGREQILELVQGLVEVGFTAVTTVPIAVRGEGLALLRRTWHQADGFDLPLLAVGEVDADGRTTTNVMFDVEDMSAAMAELDRRYLEGEGAEHAWMIRPGIAFWHGYNARDWDGVRRAIADEVELVDHRLASAGTTIQTADQFVAYAQAMIELVPNLVAFEAEYLAMGRAWALSRQVAHGTSTEGAEIELETLILADSRDGRFTHTETFAPEQLAEALTRFAELETTENESGGPTSSVD